MITAEVRLYATLRKYSPETGVGEPVVLQMPEGSRLADLLVRLGVPKSEVKTSFVNNRHQDDDYRLRDGDRVAFFPPVAGG
ncbi:MAG: MoaD/ThiS family protein [Chloroflexi bacterium]|nr:MoaD/ThiS family protein [Chloroflexota bacterium]